MRKIKIISVLLFVSMLALFASSCKTGGTTSSKKSRLLPFTIGVNGVSKWGFMDDTGKIVIKPEFEAVNNFSEGLALVVMKGRGKENGIVGNCVGYVDETGKIVVEPQYRNTLDRNIFLGERFRQFSDGLAVVRIDNAEGRGEKTIVIDKTGQVVIEPQFKKASVFSDGWAAVEKSESNANKIFYIDKTGKTVLTLPDGYHRYGNFSEGLAWFNNTVIDKTGKVVFTMPNFAVSDPWQMTKREFKDGVSEIIHKDSLVFFVDAKGKEIRHQ